MTTVPSTATDHEAIVATIERYVEGGRRGDSALMKTAFHPDATIHGHVGGELFGGPIQKLLDWNARNGPASGLTSRIVAVDVAHTVATVRLELDDWTGMRFTDQFTLLKSDGAWTIVSKVFHLHT